MAVPSTHPPTQPRITTIASGVVHAKFAFFTGVAITAGTLAMQHVIPAGPGISLILGGWMGYLIDPDLDELQRTYTEGRVFRYLGRRVGKVWQAVWAPYAALIDHRSFWSHIPGVGTVIRALWLGIVLALPFLAFVAFFGPPVLDVLPNLDTTAVDPTWLFWLLAGWSVQDGVHWALDGFPLNNGSRRQSRGYGREKRPSEPL
ncbi:MAG: DUF2227 family putative metal-binding protein [Caldilineaceae bacterium]|nr:DUF2227 family putative metal-binding protein [Caldilineaceae bacterium]MBP9072836.1 DUF2227 family putative metal-binding protein [Caldilineaceae bacterium]